MFLMFWGSWNVLYLGLGGCPTCENSTKSNEDVSALHCLANVIWPQHSKDSALGVLDGRLRLRAASPSFQLVL